MVAHVSSQISFWQYPALLGNTQQGRLPAVTWCHHEENIQLDQNAHHPKRSDKLHWREPALTMADLHVEQFHIHSPVLSDLRVNKTQSFSLPVLWCFSVLSHMCDCKLHVVATAWLSNTFFSLNGSWWDHLWALLHCNVWHHTCCYQLWDEREIIFRDAVVNMRKAKRGFFGNNSFTYHLYQQSAHKKSIWPLAIAIWGHILTMLSHILPF